jgi:hypothetical protein
VPGATGHERPGTLKVSIGYFDSYIGEGEISYAGPNAVARGRLALDIVKERLDIMGVATTETQFSLVGVDSVHRGAGATGFAEPAEVRIRVAGRTSSHTEALLEFGDLPVDVGQDVTDVGELVEVVEVVAAFHPRSLGL